MTELAVNTFILLFVVIDPVGLAPMYVAMCGNESRLICRKTAVKGVCIAAIILVLFLFTGESLLHYLGIRTASFSIAGGILLLLLAIDMVLVRQSGLRSTTHSEQVEARHREDISVFPLAIPMIAGPGSLTTILLLRSESVFSTETAIILVVLLVVLLITLIMLVMAVQITGLLGETGANVITRVLGILLTALAIQYIVNGLLSTFPFLGMSN